MSEQQELQVRAEMSRWNSRQALAGNFALAATILAAMVVVQLWSDPSGGWAALSGLAVLAVIVSAVWLLSCAGRVVQLRQSIEPVQSCEPLEAVRVEEHRMPGRKTRLTYVYVNE